MLVFFYLGQRQFQPSALINDLSIYLLKSTKISFFIFATCGPFCKDATHIPRLTFLNKSDRPEVRGTADFYGGAYPLSKTSFFAADRRAGTDSSILRYADTIGHHFDAICAPRKDRDAECATVVEHISALFHPTALATDNGRAPHYQSSLQGGCCLGGGGGALLPCPPSFGLGTTPP